MLITPSGVHPAGLAMKTRKVQASQKMQNSYNSYKGTPHEPRARARNVVSPIYIDMTVQMMMEFGAHVEKKSVRRPPAGPAAPRGFPLSSGALRLGSGPCRRRIAMFKANCIGAPLRHGDTRRLLVEVSSSKVLPFASFKPLWRFRDKAG